MAHREPLKAGEQDSKTAEVFWEEYDGSLTGDDYNHMKGNGHPDWDKVHSERWDMGKYAN